LNGSADMSGALTGVKVARKQVRSGPQRLEDLRKKLSTSWPGRKTKRVWETNDENQLKVIELRPATTRSKVFQRTG